MTERGESIEVSAGTVDDAVTEALEQLGLSRDKVEVDIVKEGGRSLLGLLFFIMERPMGLLSP